MTSILMDKGVPGIVERTLIRPPSSQLGPITKAERAAVMAASPMSGKYDECLDRNSAAEMLAKRAGKTSLKKRRASTAKGVATPEKMLSVQQAGGLRRPTRCGAVPLHPLSPKNSKSPQDAASCAAF